MSFEMIYANVPADQREALRHFRETHPIQTRDLRGTRWTYLVGGPQDKPVILWLVGGLRMADAAYRSIPLLEDEFRIVAPDYPAIDTMAALTDGLADLLTAEGVSRAHVLAGSFGGMVAQVFARRHPRRIGRLILSTTAVLDEASAERYRQQLELMTAAPPEVLAQVSQARFLEMIAPPDSERAFWAAYVEELFTERLSRADQLSTVRCLLDFAHSYPLSPDDLADWGERILLIEAEDDATFDAEARARLRALYPGARIHRFEAGGHSPATTRREEYFSLVRNFLKGV